MSTAFPYRCECAQAVLACLGPEGESALGRVVLKGDPLASSEAPALLPHMGTNAVPGLALVNKADEG
jgi:hypothetical protein